MDNSWTELRICYVSNLDPNLILVPRGINSIRMGQIVIAFRVSKYNFAEYAVSLDPKYGLLLTLEVHAYKSNMRMYKLFYRR